MKKNYIFLSLALCAVQLCANAQKTTQKLPFYLGKSEGLFSTSKLKSVSTQQGTVRKMDLAVSSSKTFTAKINYTGTTESGKQELVGELEGVPSSVFFIKSRGKSLEGSIILKSTKEAYKYYSDSLGNAYVKPISIDSLICVDYETGTSTSSGVKLKSTATVSSSTLSLESYPGANGCVLLDFDGQYVVNAYWNSGNAIDAQAFDVTDDNIQEAWELISEDYRPFNINITTSETVYNTYPANRRMRCIFTSTTTAAPGAGGVAYVGSFNWGNETPCWVFMAGGKYGGEAASHEIGHTLGLSHDGRTTPVEEYYAGQGDWAPIMGVGYYESITQWSKGEYNYPSNTQDDLAIISGSTYGLGYKTDDHGNTISTATSIKYDASGNVLAADNYGFIGTTGDVDMFSFATSGGTVALTFSTATRHADLDILVTLYNSAGTAVATYNPTGLTSSISTTLTAGTYYLGVTGTGSGTAATDGYSNYGSLGYYAISGTIPPSTTSTYAATFYKNCNYSTTGYAVGLDAGNYTTAQLVAKGISDNDISSIKITSGYEVVLYKGDNFTGTVNAYTSDVSCLVSYSLNDSTSSVRVRTVANQLPSVSLTSPASGTVYNGTSDITITATASDADGSIAKVEFYNGTTKLGESASSPYTFTWSSVAVGTYTIIATATDDRGGQSSAQISVQVASLVGATVYQNCSYGGYAVDLAPGSYTLSQLIAKGAANDDISSIKVKDGYQAILYQNDNFGGSAYSFVGDFSCLVSLYANNVAINLNDWTSSIVVQATTSSAAASSSAANTVALAGSEIAQDNEKIDVIISPNPFADNITVQLKNSTTGICNVKILNANGKEVFSSQKLQSGAEISLDGIAPGIYVAIVQTEQGTITKKILKL